MRSTAAPIPAARRAFLTDALGSTIAMTDSADAVAASYTYEPYGKASKTGTSSNTQTYTGREDDGTGLYYYRARYYHPGLSRFISEDPIEYVAGPNVYGYVDGDPVSNNDREGLFLTTTLNAATRGPNRIPTQDAIRISNFSSAVGVSATAVAAGPLAIAGPASGVGLVTATGGAATISATTPGRVNTILNIIDLVNEISGVSQGKPPTPTPPGMDPAGHVERAKNPTRSPRAPTFCPRP